MFIRWTLFFIICFIISCQADLELSNIAITKINSNNSNFFKVVSDPFLNHFLKLIKKPKILNSNVLYFREIKHFIQKLKISKQAVYLYNETFRPKTIKLNKLNFYVSDSWSLGPKGGMLTYYHLAENFQLLGKTANNFVLKKINPMSNELVNIKLLKDFFLKQSTTDFGLGFGYKSNLAKFNLTLNAFYDFHVINDWESLILLAQLKNKAVITLDDFYFHGLSGILKIDF